MPGNSRAGIRSLASHLDLLSFVVSTWTCHSPGLERWVLGGRGGGRVSTVKWPGFAARLLVQPVILLFLFVAPVPWSVHWGRDNPVVTDVRWGRSCRKHTSEITAYVKCRREGSYEEFSSSLQFLTQPVRESQDSSWVWWKLWLPSVFSAKVGNCLIRLLD